MKLGTKVLIILVSAMLLMAMAGEAAAYTPVVKVSIVPIFGTLNGQVITSSGNAVSGATVTAWDMNDIQQGGPVTTDSNGFFNISLIGGSSYYVTANRSDVGKVTETIPVTANKVESPQIIIYSIPNVLSVVPSKSTIMANGSDAVAVQILLQDAFGRPPGDTDWYVNLTRGDSSVILDSSEFIGGGYTFTYGPLPQTTTMTSVPITVKTYVLPSTITKTVTLTVVKPDASPTPTPTPGPSPSPSAQTATPTAPISTPTAIPPAASPSTTTDAPTVSQEPVNTTVTGSTDSNGTSQVQTQTTGATSSNETTLIYIIGGLLVVIAFMLGVGATYFLLQKKK